MSPSIRRLLTRRHNTADAIAAMPPRHMPPRYAYFLFTLQQLFSADML